MWIFLPHTRITSFLCMCLHSGTLKLGSGCPVSIVDQSGVLGLSSNRTVGTSNLNNDEPTSSRDTHSSNVASTELQESDELSSRKSHKVTYKTQSSKTWKSVSLKSKVSAASHMESNFCELQDKGFSQEVLERMEKTQKVSTQNLFAIR